MGFMDGHLEGIWISHTIWPNDYPMAGCQCGRRQKQRLGVTDAEGHRFPKRVWSASTDCSPGYGSSLTWMCRRIGYQEIHWWIIIFLRATCTNLGGIPGTPFSAWAGCSIASSVPCFLCSYTGWSQLVKDSHAIVRLRWQYGTMMVFLDLSFLDYHGSQFSSKHGNLVTSVNQPVGIGCLSSA